MNPRENLPPSPPDSIDMRPDLTTPVLVVQGYGLGLSIAQRIAYEHNGKIRVTSENDNSNTFYVKFRV